MTADMRAVATWNQPITNKQRQMSRQGFESERRTEPSLIFDPKIGGLFPFQDTTSSYIQGDQS